MMNFDNESPEFEKDYVLINNYSLIVQSEYTQKQNTPNFSQIHQNTPLSTEMMVVQSFRDRSDGILMDTG